MIVVGYKLNAYNATYEKAYFNVQEGRNSSGNRVLEITEDNSGITFILEYEFEGKKKRKDPRKKHSCKI